jgi:peptidoglycan/LPS O-acetylase OafA/YrhL
MLLGLKSRLYCERRRLLFVASLAFLSGFFMYLRSDVHLWGWHIAWVTGALYASIVGCCALIVCLFLPSMRFMIEAVAVSRLVLSLAILAMPGLGPLLLSDPLITALVIVSGGMLVSRLMHGRILKDRATTWRARLLPRYGLQRRPVRIDARDWQYSFVGWMDAAEPVRV